MQLLNIVEQLPERSGSLYYFSATQLIEVPFRSLYEEVQVTIRRLKSWGVKPHTRVGIFSPNCHEWLIHDLALIQMRVVSVAFTDDFSSRTAAELVKKYNLSLLLVAKSGSYKSSPTEKFIAYIDAPNASVEAIPRQPNDTDEEFLKPWIAFSSGSAGGIKGIIPSRKGAEVGLDRFVKAVGTRHDDRLLLFLPMSNFQQRLQYYTALWYDCDLIVTNYTRLLEALERCKPSILIAPPMFFEAMETRFVKTSAAKMTAAQIAFSVLSALGLHDAKRALARRIFPDFYAAIGPRMRIMMTGMAPTKRMTLKFFADRQFPIAESYGMVEAGALTYRPPESPYLGSVGRLIDGVTVTFLEDGEMVVHRDPRFSYEYLESAPGEKETTYLRDGRISTGDIGRLDEHGNLVLMGRKKEVIVTAGGYKIHPEAVEAEIDVSPDILKSVVFDSTSGNSLTAVILLKTPPLPGAEQRIRDLVDAVSTKLKVARIGQIIFTNIPFTRENGMLRPNLKLDRPMIARRFEVFRDAAKN